MKLFSGLSHLSLKFISVMNFKMPTIGILKFMAATKDMVLSSEQKKKKNISFVCTCTLTFMKITVFMLI